MSASAVWVERECECECECEARAQRRVECVVVGVCLLVACAVSSNLREG